MIDHESRINDSGLVIITPTSVSGTGVTSSGGQISLSSATTATINGVFSATYSNYRVITDLVASGASPGLVMRLASAGTPNTTAGNYRYVGPGLRYDTGAAVNDFSGTSATSFTLTIAASTYGQMPCVLDFSNPFASQPTCVNGFQIFADASVAMYGRTFQGSMSVSTSYDGIQFAPGSGSMTGTIRIYGYQNS